MPKICKKSVCFYCITTSLWRTPVNYLLTVWPARLNTRSDDTEEAGMARYLFATTAILGKNT